MFIYTEAIQFSKKVDYSIDQVALITQNSKGHWQTLNFAAQNLL
jgi:hypothetical protein